MSEAAIGGQQVNAIIGVTDDGFYDLRTGDFLTPDQAAELSAQYGLDFPYQTTMPINAVDAATNQANLNTAAAQAAQIAGLPADRRASWSQSQAVAYVQAFKQIILSNPGQFNDLTVAMAQKLNPVYDFDSTGLIDPNAFVLKTTDAITEAANDVRTMWGEPAAKVQAVATGLLDALNGFGKSLSNLGTLSSWIVPVAAIGFLWFAVQATGNDPGGQFSKVVRSFR